MNPLLAFEHSPQKSVPESNSEQSQTIQQSQEKIYDFFLDLVRQNPAETVLLEFKNFFLFGVSALNQDAVRALYDIILTKNEVLFKNTFKRAIYIVVNNWTSRRKYKYIPKLTQEIATVKSCQNTVSRSLKLLRNWVCRFIESEDYQEIELLAEYHNPGSNKSWNHRYTSFLLIPQYLDLKNPREQREIARNLAHQLKERFKFNLAMFSLHSASPASKGRAHENPTNLGLGAIRLIKKLVSHNLEFSYDTYSRIFIAQVQELNHQDFKASFYNYLTLGITNPVLLKIATQQLFPKLSNLYPEKYADSLDFYLFLRTCRRTIELLTTEDAETPSPLFIAIASQENSLTLVVMLLKIILICRYVRSHLDICIAKLIRFYEKFPEQECQWFINFLEVFNVVFAIYTENIQYHLVRPQEPVPDVQKAIAIDACRIFPQLKSTDLRGADLSNIDLHAQNLSAVDLRDANLCGADLSEAKLSLAKLSQANLNNAILEGADLVAAHLTHANVCGASLSRANLGRANLQQSDLRCANFTNARLKAAHLSAAKLAQAELRQADLCGADLSHANLSHANLSHANLSNANLSHANLSNANLSHANLSNANLSNANLQGAILRHATLIAARLNRANLSNTELSHANLTDADLSQTDLSESCFRHVKVTGANLSGAYLHQTNLFKTKVQRACVKNARLIDAIGLSTKQKQMLEEQGATFEPA